MKAAIVQAPKSSPVYGDFDDPAAQEGHTIVQVKASALTQLTKSRASGSHYSSDDAFPAIAGTDGVGLTTDGQRVYFARPESPFGALAERTLVRTQYCIPVPEHLDDVTAAAIANPGMSAWAALMERAHLSAGETVLVNGATGTAGRLAVQLARYLGAGKVIATGRNEAELEQVKALGADVVIPFAEPFEENGFEEALIREFGSGVQVVVDYLWGQSARTIIAAIAKGVEDGAPVRFVHVGGASGEESIDLPGAGLRSSSIVLMGSGYKSVPLPALFAAVRAPLTRRFPPGFGSQPRQLLSRQWSSTGTHRASRASSSPSAERWKAGRGACAG